MARVMNQTAMTGPNRKPIAPLPRLCTKKRQTRTKAAFGTTYGVTAGDATPSPSMALRTDMAGVIMASPKNRDAPASPTIKRTVRNGPATGSARDNRAIVPPSPSLSARMTKTTYLSATTSTMAQNTSESMPSTVVSSEASPAALSDSLNA
jgi:hypothetical protein